MIPEGDMSGLLAQAQAMQEQLLRAQEELAETQVAGHRRAAIWSPLPSPAPASWSAWSSSPRRSIRTTPRRSRI